MTWQRIAASTGLGVVGLLTIEVVIKNKKPDFFLRPSTVLQKAADKSKNGCFWFGKQIAKVMDLPEAFKKLFALPIMKDIGDAAKDVFVPLLSIPVSVFYIGSGYISEITTRNWKLILLITGGVAGLTYYFIDHKTVLTLLKTTLQSTKLYLKY
mmetsp:Transcript_18566/g.26045  ORF Transcript_18566/g.26045 Transcript_18566/m.26045 type:complete len:154 (-) Transcript_18566:41-502(-)